MVWMRWERPESIVNYIKTHTFQIISISPSHSNPYVSFDSK